MENKDLVIGVIGSYPEGEVGEKDRETARKIGELIACMGAKTLTGGKMEGITNDILEGAESVGGETIAVVKKDQLDATISGHAKRTIQAPELMNDKGEKTSCRASRNIGIAVHSDVVIRIGGKDNLGTILEALLALKEGKRIIVIDDEVTLEDICPDHRYKDLIAIVPTPERAMELIQDWIGRVLIMKTK